MANRILRDWTDSENVDKLTAEAERFFTRLIMKADDFGYFHANPKLLIAALFPLKEIGPAEVEGWLNECFVTGLILKYEVDGKKYLQIVDFKQRLRTMVSKFPPNDNPPPSPVSDPPPSGDTPPPEGKGREGKPEEEAKGNADKRPPQQKPEVDDSKKPFRDQYLGSFSQVDSARRILMQLKQPFAESDVVKLIDAFDPEFHVTYKGANFQKYCFRFLDYLKDEKRLKTNQAPANTYKRSTRPGR